MSELSRHRDDWEALGLLDPLYAVLSSPEAKHGRWDEGAFFRSGERDAQRLLVACDRLGLPTRRREALELGCGVGRLVRPLATRFGRCVGVDISSAMIARARQLNSHLANCDWVVGAGADLRAFADGRFDLVLSVLVLQHVPRQELILDALGEMARVLAPGGLLVAQLPASMPLRQRLQPRRRAYAALRRTGLSDRVLYRRLDLNPIRMNWVPRPRVERRLTDAGARVLAVELGWLGDRARTGREVNLTYLATRAWH